MKSLLYFIITTAFCLLALALTLQIDLSDGTRITIEVPNNSPPPTIQQDGVLLGITTAPMQDLTTVPSARVIEESIHETIKAK